MLENISRRKMLRSLGVVGASSVILSPTDVASANEAREVEILTGDQRERTIQAAQDDPEFQKIIRKFKKIGNPNYENSICDRVQPDDGDPYTFIVLSFESNNKDTQINAVWMDRSVDGQMPRILGHKATLNSSSKWEIAVTTIDKNSGETTTKQNTLQIGDEASVAPGDIAEPPPGGGGDGCVVEIVTCDSWDWDCILGWVATATTTIAQCAACLPDPTKITCGLCMMSLVGAGASFHGCSDGTYYQDECYTTYKWVSYDDLQKANANSNFCI